MSGREVGMSGDVHPAALVFGRPDPTENGAAVWGVITLSMKIIKYCSL